MKKASTRYILTPKINDQNELVSHVLIELYQSDVDMAIKATGFAANFDAIPATDGYPDTTSVTTPELTGDERVFTSIPPVLEPWLEEVGDPDCLRSYLLPISFGKVITTARADKLYRWRSNGCRLMCTDNSVTAQIAEDDSDGIVWSPEILPFIEALSKDFQCGGLIMQDGELQP